jgi:hypothetical protein
MIRLWLTASRFATLGSHRRAICGLSASKSLEAAGAQHQRGGLVECTARVGQRHVEQVLDVAVDITGLQDVHHSTSPTRTDGQFHAAVLHDPHTVGREAALEQDGVPLLGLPLQCCSERGHVILSQGCRFTAAHAAGHPRGLPDREVRLVVGGRAAAPSAPSPQPVTVRAPWRHRRIGGTAAGVGDI